MRGAEKITASHWERLALIYIRQSSMAQVRENTESTARQYALADEAVRFGWPRSQVEVIDADLGLSGRSAEGRSGFKDLVGRVCLGEVGAIFGLEISRLARSSADLSRLLELARLTDTLVVDSDGIYRPSASPISVSVTPQRSSSRYQSALFLASLETSSPSTMPTRPRATSAVSRAKPVRLTLPDPERPRSSSMTMICSRAQPSSAALAVSAYCRWVDSWWFSTWEAVDCRTYTTA
jgi:Resolvase, N terminal domain